MEMCGCARIRQDITIKGLEYIKLPGTGIRLEDIQDVKICCELSKMQLGYARSYGELEKEVETRWKWKKFDE